MTISIIIGSVREGRQTHKIAQYLFQELAKQETVDAVLLDLADYDLPMLTDRWKKQAKPDQSLRAFASQLNETDGLVFCSPEYHGSYSGVLKNAVDHYWEEFKRKPIGVVSVGSGRYGGINASSQMQQLILSLGAFPMPYKLLVPYVKEAFDEEGQLIREDTLKDSGKFIRELLWFTKALTTTDPI